MYAETCVENHAVPGDGIRELERGCLLSEFQFLDSSPLSVEISDEGGTYFPDFILHGCIPLVSGRMRRVLLEDCHADYLFYKPIRLTYAEQGISEGYWLALPPRINCLDLANSLIDVEENEDLPPSELIREARKIVISSSQVGRYGIFRLAGVAGQEIIVTDDTRAAIEAGEFENVFFYALEE